MVCGREFDFYSERYRRHAGGIPEFLVEKPVEVSFRQPIPGTEIRFTLDGSEPCMQSAFYSSPLKISESVKLRARAFAADWPFGANGSEVVKADFRKVELASAEAIEGRGLSSGLLLEVHEIATVHYDDKGFFDANKILMPDLRNEEPVSLHLADIFELPRLTPQKPWREQRKGFFNFKGWFNAPADGIYEFAVDSCGPVTLDVGKQTAIEEIGQYHQHQRVRHGEVALATGWHKIALTVCDPIFWKVNTDGAMPLRVSYRLDRGEEHGITNSQLLRDPSGKTITELTQIPGSHETFSYLLEPGLERFSYERHEMEREESYFEINDLTPFMKESVTGLEANTNGNVVEIYNGYFFAPSDGVYAFELPSRTSGSIDRNQLRIGAEVVLQQGSPGRNPCGKISLKAGYHPLSIRLGSSRAKLLVSYPGDSSGKVDISFSGLYRPKRVAITPEGVTGQQTLYELFKPADFIMSLTGLPGDTEIRFTLDGNEPDTNSSRYEGPIRVERDTTIAAAAFKGGEALTLQAVVRCQAVDLPQALLLGYFDFNKLKEEMVPAVSGNISARSDGATLAEESGKPALHLSGGKIGLHLRGIGMALNALSVSLWLNADDVGGGAILTDAKYRSILNAGYSSGGFQISQPHGNRFSGGNAKKGEWQHVVFAWDGLDAFIYVDGILAAKGRIQARLHTESLEMLRGYKGLVRNLRIYNKALALEEVGQIHKVEGARSY